ncbi:hypothetical protein E2C01_012977 [Portunus trituberculatus]|uniref:Uncharacterized protein n=1 Tax=Portunus trituberculatus TaxID=210409 RepID=A0A5B7DFQ6_PORTR|nr:hypothetical protein [Portunus trituberculatus]
MQSEGELDPTASGMEEEVSAKAYTCPSSCISFSVEPVYLLTSPTHLHLAPTPSRRLAALLMARRS